MNAGLIKGVMIVSGLLTMSMLFVAIDPAGGLDQSFGPAARGLLGEPLPGPISEIIVRNWGALIALVGAALVYGAFVPGARTLSLLQAIISKTVFIGLVVTSIDLANSPALVAVIVDSVMILLFVLFLVRPSQA